MTPAESDWAVPAYRPGRNDLCFCQSGKRFKHCCGNTGPQRATPHGIVVIEDYLSREQCQQILDLCAARPSEPLTVVNSKATSVEKVVRTVGKNRVTQRVDMSHAQQRLNDIVRTAIVKTIEPDLGRRFEWFEEPQLLRYEEGGFYGMHADSENPIPPGDYWRKVTDRDISLLLYLDDNYEGGQLRFGCFDYLLQPKAGMLVYFPSDHRYRHTAMKVTSGTRHAIVSWSSQQGVAKLRQAPKNAVQLPA